MNSQNILSGDSAQKISEQVQYLESLVEFYKNGEARKGKHLEGKLLILEAFQQQAAMEEIYDNVLDVILEVTGYSSGFLHLLVTVSNSLRMQKERVGGKNVTAQFSDPRFILVRTAKDWHRFL